MEPGEYQRLAELGDRMWYLRALHGSHRFVRREVKALLRGLMALEAAWLRLGGRWAWGCSILAVGRKPA
ncbi:MAG TPA: hypothetical protein VMD31_04720 [Opitutaceae bacterium]|nr:hypothetical protein [Opitutaceae bacterium]